MTFTVLTASPATGAIAIATASFSLAVGASVPAVRPGLGAVASQAYTNRALRSAMLETLSSGLEPRETVAAMADHDPELEYRQLAVINAQGTGSAFTGSNCTGWAGHLVGDGFVIAGNYLAGPGVLDAMAHELATARDDGSPESLAARVLAALAAGDAAGGDSRGRQSAALAVASGALTAENPPTLAIDLRVDDAPRPIDELSRLLGILESVRAQTA